MENRLVIDKYSEQYYPPTPTNTTLFWRRFIPFQLIRFMILNWKIIRIVAKGHS
ncbi:hypothetical protein [uncultured Mucilaginibacter sp.]|uniref:hypothetical protein n=1 Tax=uncultured Mucilaginibacter sp. TaxID=797541 RepID=UPI0025D69730|nr:hypothetical protein [uncultured Mucilaginibacter sp.]